jgi:hypothetical protein
VILNSHPVVLPRITWFNSLYIMLESPRSPIAWTTHTRKPLVACNDGAFPAVPILCCPKEEIYGTIDQKIVPWKVDKRGNTGLEIS